MSKCWPGSSSTPILCVYEQLRVRWICTHAQTHMSLRATHWCDKYRIRVGCPTCILIIKQRSSSLLLHVCHSARRSDCVNCCGGTARSGFSYPIVQEQPGLGLHCVKWSGFSFELLQTDDDWVSFVVFDLIELFYLAVVYLPETWWHFHGPRREKTWLCCFKISNKKG